MSCRVVSILLLICLTGCASAPRQSVTDFSTISVAVGQNAAAGNVQEGLFLLRRGALTAAQDQFNLALQKDPENSYLHYLTALCYHLRMLDGDPQQRELAEQGYLYAIGLDPTNWLATYQLALFYQDIRRWRDASHYWQLTLSFRGDDPQVLRNAIYSAYYARDLNRARALMDSYREVENDQARFDELAAIIFAAAGEPDAASDSLNRLPSDMQSRLGNRVRDWSKLYEMAQERFAEAESREQPEESYAPQDEDEVYEDDEYEMNRALAVDVVIIRTTEEIGSSRGVNLIKQLQLSLGDPLQEIPGYSNVNEERTDLERAFGDVTRQFVESDVISRAITVPAINYSMNIANVTGTRNEVLARPTLIAQDGEESSFFSGSHINAVAVGGSNSDGATESIDVDVGVSLRIGAEFHDDDEFTLAVEAERTFLQEPNTSAVTFPLFVSYSKTRAEATVRMKFGQSLILSGLSEKETSKLRDSVPVLGDIPVMQYLFSKRTTRDFQSSVVLLITPHPPQYVYSDSGGGEALSEVQEIFGTHWQPYPNIAQVFQHMESNRLFREFRTGDVRVEKWLSQESFNHRLQEVQRFILEI